MALTKWDDSVQQFTADRADEALGVGVEVRAVRGETNGLHTGVGEYLADIGGEDGVAVHDQVPRRKEEAIDRVEELPEDEFDPRTVGVVGDASVLDAPGLEVDDEQDPISNEPPHRQDLDVEKVRGEDVPEMGTEKIGPLYGPVRRGVDTLVGENTGNGRAAHGVAEDGQGTSDAGVSPRRVVMGELDDERTDLLSDTRTPRSSTSRAIILLFDELAVPAQQRVQGDKRVELPEDAAARSSSSSSKTTALCVGEAEPPPCELLVEDSVLYPQVVDHLSVAVIDQGGQQDHHQGERAPHQPSVVEMNAAAEKRCSWPPPDFWDTTRVRIVQPERCRLRGRDEPGRRGVRPSVGYVMIPVEVARAVVHSAKSPATWWASLLPPNLAAAGSAALLPLVCGQPLIER